MAWQYVGSTTGVGTSTGYTVSLSGTLTGGIASSPASGDLVVVISAFGNTASSAPNVSGNNSGAYVGIGTAIHANDTWDTEARPFYQVMGGTPDTSLTITRVTNTAYGGATVVHVWRGVDTTSPFIGSAQTSGTNGCVINCPSYDPAVTDSLIFAAGAGTMAATSNAYTGITGMSNFVTTKGDGSTSDCAAAMATYDYAGVAYDPAAISGGTTSTSSSWAGFTFAFRMAPPPNYDFTLNNGSYTLTGQSTTISLGKVLEASNGNYTLLGQSATITYTPNAVNYDLIAQFGSYAYTGQSADLVKGRTLSANSGTYTLTGQTAVLLKSKMLESGFGTYSIVGQSQTLLRSKTIDASSGTYVVSGQSATISYTQTVGYELIANSGSYSLSGQGATLLKTRIIDAQYGEYIYGEAYVSPGYINDGYFGNTSLLRNKVLVASHGTYAITGRAASYAISYIFPPPSVVLEGIVYGDLQQFVGTYNPYGVKINLTDGSLVKPINDKAVITL